MTEQRNEPPDSHMYAPIWVTGRAASLFRRAFSYYRAVLSADLHYLTNDPELGPAVGDIDSLPVAQEAARIARIEAWLADESRASGPLGDLTLSLSHEYVRLTKSVCLLYLSHLHQRRDELASRPSTSTHLLRSVDGALAALDETMNSGVFANASPSPLLTADALSTIASAPVSPEPHAPWSPVPRPQPAVLLQTIEILDEELRSRCLDLFSSFSAEGQHERLDTVVTEATRVFENRLRQVSGAPAHMVGVELAQFAFSGPTPKLRVSPQAAEQEAAHLLVRGLFGFIRNHVHHRLTGRLVPQRVLQILGMVDYLLSLSASTPPSGGGDSA